MGACLSYAQPRSLAYVHTPDCNVYRISRCVGMRRISMGTATTTMSRGKCGGRRW
jgi:hypothetical protein